MPVLVTPWWSPPSTGLAAQSPKLPGPSHILVSAESYCAHDAKESIPPPQQAEPSRRLWPPLPSSSSNWVASAAPSLATPGEHVYCLQRSHSSSAKNGKHSCAGWPPLVNLCANLPQRLGSDERPLITIWLRTGKLKVRLSARVGVEAMNHRDRDARLVLQQ